MKEYLVNYYDNTRQYYGQYHNHKELSAWAGLVIHLLFCQLVAQMDCPKATTHISAVAFTVFVVLVAYVVYHYIRNQLQMKDVAGAHAAAASFLLSEIIQRPDEQISIEHYMSIEESADTQAQSRHVLPKVLLTKSEVLNTRARGFQDKTKWMVDTLLLLSTVGTIGYKWLSIFS